MGAILSAIFTTHEANVLSICRRDAQSIPYISCIESLQEPSHPSVSNRSRKPQQSVAHSSEQNEGTRKLRLQRSQHQRRPANNDSVIFRTEEKYERISAHIRTKSTAFSQALLVERDDHCNTESSRTRVSYL